MSAYYVPIFLTILANLGYHLSTKKIDGGINPFFSLAVTYLVAFGVCLVLLGVTGLDGGARVQFAKLNWASYLLGAAIVLLEFGFILAYRAGWNLSLAGLYSNVAVGLSLVPIGILFFRETLSMTQIAGILFALVGLALMTR